MESEKAKQLTTGMRVRHTERCSGMKRETGEVVDIIHNWNNGLGRPESSGIYTPPEVLVKLDEEFVTGGNTGFCSAPMDHWEGE